MHEDSLERRELLKFAAGAALASAAAGCASSPRREAATPIRPDVNARLDPKAARRLVDKVDRRMAWIREAFLPEEILPLSKLPRSAEGTAEFERTRTLVGATSPRSAVSTTRGATSVAVQTSVPPSISATTPRSPDVVAPFVMAARDAAGACSRLASLPHEQQQPPRAAASANAGACALSSRRGLRPP
jgi:hypothetical protein